MTLWTSRRERFDRLHLSELDYESLILTTGDQAFSNWDILRWKKRVYTADGRGVEADAVLLHKTTNDWVVIEVGLASHSITGHVQDQLERLAEAQYGPHVTKSLATASGRTFEEMQRFTRNPPDFLCIADDYTERLSDSCTSTGFRLAVLAPYRSMQHSALRMVRMPAQYREIVPEGAIFRYIFARGDSVFGHKPFIVPQEFPALKDLRITAGDAVYALRITFLKGVRLMFWESTTDWLSQQESLVISLVDLDSGIFKWEG